VTIENRIKVVEVMALAMDPPVVFDVETPLRDVIHRMRDDSVGCALLTRNGELAGIFTERDLVVCVLGNKAPLDLPVAEWMTPDPERVTYTDTVRKTVRLMQQHGFRSVPVVDEVGRVTGCVRHKDIINYLAEHLAEHVLNLPPDHEQIAIEREGG
jgi:signal-transduction protein with cAMP-binding, CBS, and nucleotidyltransferase domain